MAAIQEVTIFVLVVYDIHNCVASEMALHASQKAALSKDWHSNAEKSPATPTSSQSTSSVFLLCHTHLQSIWKLLGKRLSLIFAFLTLSATGATTQVLNIRKAVLFQMHHLLITK